MNKNLLRSYTNMDKETNGSISSLNRISIIKKFEKDNEFNIYQNNLDEMIWDFKNRIN
jgi:hypothetical protein